LNYSHISKLYKYKSIDKRLVDSLSVSKIYAPTIDQLNDPFESKIKIRSGLLSKKSIESINRFIEKINLNSVEIKNNISIETLSNLIFDNSLSFPSDIEFDKFERKNELIKEIVKKYGVLSFTVDNKSLLMWSHYGDSHKGICFGFERTPENILGSSDLCFPINYSTFRKEVDYTEDPSFIADIFRIKADIWSYEKEWRLLVKDGRSHMDFPGDLKEVYFGLNTSTKSIGIIKEILKTRVKYFRARIMDNYYKINYFEE